MTLQEASNAPVGSLVLWTGPDNTEPDKGEFALYLKVGTNLWEAIDETRGHGLGKIWANSMIGSCKTEDVTADFNGCANSKSKQCECGAEKTYGVCATHSSWCPKG